jgi:hypothetical protein
MSRKSETAWGGFVNDRLGVRKVDDYWGGSNVRDAFAIFRTKAEAREQYEDVRRIVISQAKP